MRQYECCGYFRAWSGTVATSIHPNVLSIESCLMNSSVLISARKLVGHSVEISAHWCPATPQSVGYTHLKYNGGEIVVGVLKNAHSRLAMK